MKFSDIRTAIINGLFVAKSALTNFLILLIDLIILGAVLLLKTAIVVGDSAIFKFIIKLILSPLILFNYCALKFAILLIKHNSLNVFNLKYQNLLNILPFIITVERVVILLTVMSLAPTDAMIISMFIPTSVFASILAIIVRDFGMFSIFSGIISIFVSELSILLNMVKEARDNLWYSNSEVRHKVLLAAENMDAQSLLDYLQEFSREFPKQYLWSNFYEQVFESLNLRKLGPWKNLDRTTLKYLENKFENSEVYSYILAGLSNVPVKVSIEGRTYSYDLFLLLRRMHIENGVLREHGNEAVKYSDITLDTTIINLIKQINSKANDLKSPVFKQLFTASQAKNNYQEMLKFLQQSEQNHPLELGALYWNGDLQQAWNDFENTAIKAEGKPKQHRCNMSLNIMQNPCYIVDRDDPSKRSYFELIHMLKWVSDNNSLPHEQRETDSDSANNQAIPRALLSQVYYDADLKATLDECYHQIPNPSFTPRFSSTVEPGYIQSRVTNVGRALVNVL